MNYGDEDKDVDSEELQNKTQELVEKMQLGQKGLSKCLQQTLEVINSSKDGIFEKATIADKSQDHDRQRHGILVRSYDLAKQSTAKQKLVALAKCHLKKNFLKSPTYDPTSERRKGNSFAPRLPDRIATAINTQTISFTSRCQKSMQTKDSGGDMMNTLKAFELPAKLTSDSAFEKNLSNSELETQQKITPNLVKRRRIIDKNVKVHYGEVLDKIQQECDLGLGLNYSYSNVDTDSDGADEAVYMSDSYVLDELDCGQGGVTSRYCLLEDELSTTCANIDTRALDIQSFLSDPGNIKRTERNKRKWPKTGGTSFNHQCLKSKEHKLLGYDWIASVLDNVGDTSLEISDEYFEELKNFWKEQQGRPIKDLNLLKNYVDDSQEPQLIQDILAKSKIQSYRINDRLFPEAVEKKNNSRRKDESSLDIEYKQQDFISPRYVSVTVPNNTVEVNSATQSYCKGSMDSSETLSLGKHCILGWESSYLNVPPMGTTLSMKDAMPVSKAKQILTLEEAEELAKSCHLRKISRFLANRTNPSYKPRPASLSDQSLSRHKNSTKDKRSDFLKRVAEVTNPAEEEAVSNCSARSTSELLDSAYSLMRDLDRIKQEQKLKRLAKTELGGIP